MTEIDGEIVDEPTEALPVVASESSHQVVSFNPLEMEPVAFKNALVSRSENYDALAMHLRGMLVPGQDFGRIHFVSKDKCPQWWNCSHAAEPGHWSDYQLFAPGADKVLGMLSLTPSYPGEQDFIRAALRGNDIQDVIMKCLIVGLSGAVISEGMGACSRRDMKGDLNNTIKRACKRARVDAVKRLPAISALFEDDFLASLDRDAVKKNSTTSRQQQVKAEHDTGATLLVWPLKGKLEGQRFDEMEDSALDWILRTIKNKPDIMKAAEREHARRYPDTPSESGPETGIYPREQQKSEAAARPDSGGSSAPGKTQSTADFLDEYENTPPLDFEDLEDSDEWKDQPTENDP